MILVKNCYGCGQPIDVPGGEVWVMICQSCFSVNIIRWDQDARPFHETDLMLMHEKTRLVMAWIGAEAQLRQIAELEAIA